MRRSGPAPARSSLANVTLRAACLLAGCALPTDDSGSVFVTIDPLPEVVVRGTSVTLTARTWRHTGDGRVEVPGVSLQWSSDDDRVAGVAAASPGSGVVTAFEEGVVTIRATAVDYESAQPGEVRLRVANAVEIDSVRPRTARYGEQLTVYGVGLGELAQVSLAGTPLVVDNTSFLGDPDGSGRLRFWLPFPATTGLISAVAKQGTSVSAPDTTIVLPYDIYDDAGDSPPVLDLNGPAPFAPDTLFSNPALVLESGEISEAYRFARSDTARAVSFIITTTLPVVFGFEPVLLPGPTIPSDFPEADPDRDWALGISAQYCQGGLVPIPRPFARTLPVTVVRAFRRMPARNLMLGLYGEPPGRYGLAVVDGYVVADPAIQPDRFEDDDVCIQADANAADPARHIDLAVPFTDTLTIDNPWDVDWLRFTVPGPDTTLLTVRTTARPFGAADSSNLGLLLRQAKRFGVAAESHAAGSDETLAISAPPGDYYLAVIDEAGVPTRYTVCIARGSVCSLPSLSAMRSESDPAARATPRVSAPMPPMTRATPATCLSHPTSCRRRAPTGAAERLFPR